MAGAREIRTKIKSVQNTRKVTRALEMVSTSKIRRAQEQMRTMRPYVRSMLGLVGHIARANSEYKHPFTVEREPKRVAYLVISTDRGLCGGLNNNLFRRVLADMREWQAKGATVGVYAVGSKASQFFRRLSDVTFSGHAAKIGDRPTLVVGGSHDSLFTPDTLAAWAGRIPGARHVTVAGAGHLVPMEQPAVLSQALRTWMHAA